MLKRGAEDQDGPEAKRGPGKSGGGGSVAEQVKNPIPRLFSQNTVTIHITQRTFEEIGVNELKWIPTSQFYAAMFDKFHASMFKNYYNRCSTFTITDPKIRISNVLMLQDTQKTNSNTPEDVSIFTQACYLIHYQPRGMKNWFKLGVTDDCMESQTYLTYQPMQTTDCKLVSQLVSLKNYSDFEHLVVNPAKADFYAGWHQGETMATTSDTTNLDCQLLQLEGEINVDTTKLKDDTRYYVTDTFISPRSPYLGEFSCSVKGCEPHVPMGKHTTYCRNLDKINLHKYGDSFGFHINTNLEGIHMMKHEANNPFGSTFNKFTKGSQTADTKVNSVFCYPSDNRPFYSRGTNFDMNGPIDSNKKLGGLTHHFLTMPPIRRNDKVLIKQRCSFIMEQTMSITFHFPETVTEDQAEDMLHQKDAIILRPAIVSLEKGKVEKSPDPKLPIYDNVRDKIREIVGSVTNIELPEAESIGFQDRSVSVRTPVLNRRWSLPAKLANLCESLGIGPVCSDVKAIIKGAIGNRDTSINWDVIGPISAPPDVIKEVELDDGKLIPKVHYKYELREPQLQDWEIENMIDKTTESRNNAVFGYLFWDFLFYLKKNNLLEIPHENIASEFPQENYAFEARRMNNKLIEWLKPITDLNLPLMFQEKCVDYVCRLYPDQIKSLTIWGRATTSNPDYNLTQKADFKNLISHTEKYPVDFNIADWIHYLWRMRIWVMPKYEVVKEFIDKYNACINQAIEEELPRIPLTEEQIKYLKDKGLLPTEPYQLEPIPEVKDKFFKYETSVFFA